MIKNRWYAVLDAREVRRGRPVGVVRLGEPLVFWRQSDGTVACLRDRCPHRGAQLSLGALAEGHLACPFHGFQFDAAGRCRLVPALGRAADPPAHLKAGGYVAREAHGLIWVFWGDAVEGEALPPILWFDDLDEGFHSLSFHDDWDAHYSRAIENQLDVMHLPFVHRTTIGRGGKTLVHGPRFALEGDRLTIWVSNAVDDGSPALGPEDAPHDPATVRLHFIFPNVWQNWLGPDMRVVAAFAPVDEARTRIYLRFYQRYVRVPGLRWLVSWLFNRFNRVILHQDRRVVVTQRPARSDLEIGERLVPGDGPIIAYRRRRRELIEAGQVA